MCSLNPHLRCTALVKCTQVAIHTLTGDTLGYVPTSHPERKCALLHTLPTKYAELYLDPSSIFGQDGWESMRQTALVAAHNMCEVSGAVGETAGLDAVMQWSYNDIKREVTFVGLMVVSALVRKALDVDYSPFLQEESRGLGICMHHTEVYRDLVMKWNAWEEKDAYKYIQSIRDRQQKMDTNNWTVCCGALGKKLLQKAAVKDRHVDVNAKRACHDKAYESSSKVSRSSLAAGKAGTSTQKSPNPGPRVYDTTLEEEFMS